MKISLLPTCLAAASALLLATGTPLAAEAPIPADARIVADPGVKRGRMANGLRYAVMRNDFPARSLSIRLAFEVGSYEEEDDEGGFAHFIEHMAFRSTRHSPNGLLDNRFAALGVALGRDQNATTTLESTIYRVDLPSAGGPAIRAALEWMRDAADGMNFTDAAVDLERGVVLAEKEARNSPSVQAQRALAHFQAPDLRSFNRDPAGTEESLKSATASRLRDFYHRWYRPENAILVIAGDAPVDALERAAIEHFASWTAKGEAGRRWTPPRDLPRRGAEALTQSEPGLASTLEACLISPAPLGDAPAPLERLRQDLYADVWTTILNKRLGHLAAQPGSPLLSAAALVSRDAPDARGACLMMMPTNERWREALAAGQAELRRFAEDGPTRIEVETGVEALRSRLRAAKVQSQTRISPLLADQIVEAEFSGRIFQHPAEAMRTFDIAAAGMTAEDVKKAFANDWKGNGPFLAATAPTVPTRQELLAAWQRNQQGEKLGAYADRPEARWAYSDFGKPGKVHKRETFALSDSVRFRFRNGVILNFKQTAYQSGNVEIKIRFGEGERGLDPETRMPAALAASFFPMGGLGRMSFEEISSALANTTWAFNLDIEATAFTLSSSTLSSQVGQQMQLLAAYMTDPAFGPVIDDKLPTAVDMIYRSFEAEPNAVAANALEKALFPDRLSMPPREQMMAYKAKDFERMLKPVLTRAPIEVTVVGDIKEADAVKAVARTFGALPKRAPLPPVRGTGPFRHFPEALPPPVHAAHQGPAEKAAALLMWPLYVAVPERRREEYAIGVLRSIFETRLLQRVRGTMGKTYSPAVADVMVDRADQGFLSASLEASPADLDQIVAAARAVAAELAAGRIGQEEVDLAKEPLISAMVQAQGLNGPWAAALSYASRNPEALDELIGYPAAVQALTLDDVRDAAATWLSHDPMIAAAEPAAASHPGGR